MQETINNRETVEADGNRMFFQEIIPLVRELLRIDLTSEPEAGRPSGDVFGDLCEAAVRGDRSTIPAIEAFWATEDAHRLWVLASAKTQRAYRMVRPEDSSEAYLEPNNLRTNRLFRAYQQGVCRFEKLVAGWLDLRWLRWTGQHLGVVKLQTGVRLSAGPPLDAATQLWGPRPARSPNL